MTKLYFDNWLRASTVQLEQQIDLLGTALSELNAAAAELKKELFTEMKLVIGQKTALIEGRAITLDVAPLIQESRTMVPVRFIGETFGAEVSWDGNTRRVTYQREGVKIELVIGAKQAMVNDKTVNLDAPPIIINDRTLVPIRFVGEHLDAEFAWDPSSQTVTIFF